jgi:NADH-quinone oxidoreductase subunit J
LDVLASPFLASAAKVDPVGNGPSTVFFAILAIIAVVSAIGVVAFNNPIRSALCLVANFFTLAFIYFTLKAEMLGITQIVVYTGAIMVLFLFVIMLLNPGATGPAKESRDIKRLLGVALALALLMPVLVQVIMPLQGLTQPMAEAAYGSPQALGRTLFTTYVWPFEMVSVLLLVGIVGSILLAKRRL